VTRPRGTFLLHPDARVPWIWKSSNSLEQFELFHFHRTVRAEVFPKVRTLPTEQFDESGTVRTPGTLRTFFRTGCGVGPQHFKNVHLREERRHTRWTREPARHLRLPLKKSVALRRVQRNSDPLAAVV